MVREVHRLQPNGLDVHLNRSKAILPKNLNAGNIGMMLPRLGSIDMSQVTEMERKQLDLAFNQLNQTIKTSGTEIRLKYHDEAEQIIVELLDRASREVIATSPPEYLLELSVKIKEMVGMFLDEKV